MTSSYMPNIIVIPARGCRRSQKVLDYLTTHAIPFTRIDLETPEGQALAEKYHLRASPGILVDGELVNPFDFLKQPGCRMDEAAFYETLRLPMPEGVPWQVR